MRVIITMIDKATLSKWTTRGAFIGVPVACCFAIVVELLRRAFTHQPISLSGPVLSDLLITNSIYGFIFGALWGDNLARLAPEQRLKRLIQLPITAVCLGVYFVGFRWVQSYIWQAPSDYNSFAHLLWCAAPLIGLVAGIMLFFKLRYRPKMRR